MNEDDILRALGNPHRRKLLEWLREPRVHFPPPLPEHEHLPGACATYIFEKSHLSQPTISQYLQMLERAGLLCSERNGRWTFYCRNESGIAAAQALLSRILEPLKSG
jgi:DNA-binding transcriptional ArsR family regulator